MKEKIGFMYFAFSVDRKFLKVGYTTNPHDRLRQLQPEAKKRLGQKLVMAGLLSCSRSAEVLLRRTIETIMSISARRLLPNGLSTQEWYQVTPELDRYVQGLTLIPLVDIPNPKKPRKPQAQEPVYSTPMGQYFAEIGRKGGKVGGAKRWGGVSAKDRSKIMTELRAKRTAKDAQ